MTWEFALIGLVAGYLAGLLGVGGGFVMVPALTLIFSRNPDTAQWSIHLAIATSLATMLVTSLSSLLAHHRREAVLWPLVRSMTPGLVAGAVAGAILADQLSAPVLVRVFGGFAVLVGMQLMLGRQPSGQRPQPGQPGVTVVAAAIGAISSLVGIGGGSLTVPWLLWHRVRAQVAVATSAACGYPIALAGTASYILLGRAGELAGSAAGYVHLPAFAGIAVTSALAAPLGAASVHRLPAAAVRRIFGVFLAFIGLRMLDLLG